MKKLTCTFVAILLLCLCTVAYATDPMTVDITALDYQTDLKLEDGTYYITGIVIDQPAALRVAIKDMAYNNAETAEELYNAMQKDRTVSKTYYFNAAQPAEQPIAKNPVVIPKTGGASVLAYAVSIALIGFGLAVAGKRR